MKNLRWFIELTLPTYLRVMGALTGLLGLLLALGLEKIVFAALYLPPTADRKVDGAPLDYSPLIQHWGVLLALAGFFMVAASFNESWEVPAMAISGIEKFFIVFFSVIAYDDGFVKDPGVAVDFFGTLYSLIFFVALLSGSRRKSEPRT